MSAARIPVLLVSGRSDVTELLYGDPAGSRYELDVRAPGAIDEADAAAAFPVALVDVPATPGGIALVRRLQAIARTIETVVIVEEERQGVQAVRAGSFDYVVWPPASPDVLWTVLGRCLDRVRPSVRVPSSIGDYRIVRKLGMGGMAEVFLAKAPGPDSEGEVVVKRMLPQFAGEQDFEAMFVAEANLTAILSHPNIVRVTDAGVANGAIFLAMEYVPGKNLEQVLRAAGPRLPWAVASHIVAEVCAGLAYAHEKRDRTGKALSIIHRDVNPPNILLSEDGQVKLTDFGIAKHAKSHAQTTVGALKGKLDYMSPEQLEGRPLDHRSDLFSLGTVLSLLLTGRHPFRGATEAETVAAIRQARHAPPSSVVDGVPPALDRVVARALARDRDERYASAAELEGDLRKAAAASPGRAAEIAALVVRAGGRSTLRWEDLVATGSLSSGARVLMIGTEATRTREAISPAREDTVVSARGASAPLEETVIRTGEAEPSSESTAPGTVPPGGPGAIAVRARDERTDPTIPALAAAPRPKRDTALAGGWRPFALAVAFAAPLGALVAGSGIFGGDTPPIPPARTATPARAALTSLVPAPTPTLLAARTAVPPATPTPLPVRTAAPTPPVAVAVRTVAPLRTGTLSVWMASGWAAVSVDGRAAGNAPIVGLVLPEGKHRVLLENPGAGFRRELDVVISPDKESVLRVPPPS